MPKPTKLVKFPTLDQIYRQQPAGQPKAGDLGKLMRKIQPPHPKPRKTGSGRD